MIKRDRNLSFITIGILFCLLISSLKLESGIKDGFIKKSNDIINGKPQISVINLNGDQEIDDFCAGNDTDGSSWEQAHILRDYEFLNENYKNIELKNTRRYIKIINCTFQTDASVSGIYLSNASHVKITNSTFIKSRSDSIRIENSTDIEIKDLNFHNNEVSSYYPVGIDLSKDTNNITIRNSTFHDTHTYAIKIANNYNISISNVTVENVDMISFYISNSDNINIENNTISGEVIDDGIYIQNSFLVNISNNDLGGKGIRIDENSFDINIPQPFDNLVNGYKIEYYEEQENIDLDYNNEQIGQIIFNNVNTSEIRNVKILDTNYAIQIINSNNIDLYDLIINGSSTSGIKSHSSHNILIHNYTGWNNDIGLLTIDSNNITLEESTLRNFDQQRYGIDIRNSDYVKIISNTIENFSKVISFQNIEIIEFKNNHLKNGDIDFGTNYNDIIADNSNTRNEKQILFFINQFNQTHTFGDIANAYFFNSSNMILSDGLLEGPGNTIEIVNCSWLEFRDFSILNSSIQTPVMIRESINIYFLNSTFQYGEGSYIDIYNSSNIVIKRCAFLNSSGYYLIYGNKGISNLDLVENWFFDLGGGYYDKDEDTSGNFSTNYYGFLEGDLFEQETELDIQSNNNIETNIFDRNAFPPLIYTNDMLIFDENDDTGDDDGSNDGDSNGNDDGSDDGDENNNSLDSDLRTILLIISGIVGGFIIVYIVWKGKGKSQKSKNQNKKNP